jgi:hypothetical protein
MSFLRNPRLTLGARLVVGGFFIVASVHKIAEPPDFAKVIHNYDLVPSPWIHLAALFLPWLELLAGAALAAGVPVRAAALWRRRSPGPLARALDALVPGGAAVTGLLSVTFIAALSYNLYRGHPTICGCFSTYEESLSMTDADKFAQMWREVFINGGLLLLSLQVLVATGERASEEKRGVREAAPAAAA